MYNTKNKVQTFRKISADITENNNGRYLCRAGISGFELDYWLEVAIELKKYNNEVLDKLRPDNRVLINIFTAMMKNLERREQS